MKSKSSLLSTMFGPSKPAPPMPPTATIATAGDALSVSGSTLIGTGNGSNYSVTSNGNITTAGYSHTYPTAAQGGATATTVTFPVTNGQVINGAGVWVSPPAVSMFTGFKLRFVHLDDDVKFSHQVAGIEPKTIEQVISVTYEMIKDIEKIKLDVVANAENYACIYNALFGKDYYMVLDEMHSGNVVFSRAVDILSVESMVAANNLNSAAVFMQQQSNVTLKIVVATKYVEVAKGSGTEKIFLSK